MHNNEHESYSLHDESHVGMFIDGLLDSLSGSECINLTNAQHYVQGVLFADGSTRTLSVSDVTGNEGFFSAIGDGIKKAWEYIKKMFSNIYDFFFKSEKKKLEAKVDEALKEAEKSLDAMEKSQIAPTNVEAVAKKVETAVANLPDSPEKKKLETKVEHIKAEPSAPAKAKELHELLPEVFEARLYDSNKIKNANAKLLAAVSRLQAKKKELDEADKDGHSTDGMEIQKYLNGLIGLPDISQGIRNIREARAFTGKAKRCKEAMSNTLTSFLNDEAHYKQLISEIGSGINAYTGPNDPKNVELRNKINLIKDQLAVVTGIIAITDTVSLALADISAAIEKACVSVI